ncbi:hypothetical protein X983_5389 [Burkholderia pseudomallei MSHR4003]|nr:hypothetical protein X983_5389 [Burkholderia pseudomallei MSHR4003]
MQADAGGRFSSADHGLGRARRRSSLVGRGCVRLDLARLVGGVHRRARGSGIRRRNALKEPLGGMAGPVLSCCRAVVLSCCRAVVLSCCRAIARLRDCVVGCARGRAVACSCVRVFVRRHGRVCAERSFDRAARGARRVASGEWRVASGERRAVKGEWRMAKGERAPSGHGARRAKSACARPCGAGSHGFTAHARGATACRFRRYRPSPTMPTSDTNASSEKNSASGSHSPR